MKHSSWVCQMVRARGNVDGLNTLLRLSCVVVLIVEFLSRFWRG